MADDVDDATLTAFADGRLAGAEAGRVAAAVAADPVLAARVAALAAAAGSVRALYAPLAGEPVPPALEAAVRAAARAAAEGPAATARPALPVRPPAPAPHRRTSPTHRPRHRLPRLMPAAAAASLALVLGAAGGFVLGARVGDPGAAAAVTVGGPPPVEFVRALERLPTGAELALDGRGRIRALGTFRDGAGAICREFEFDRSEAVVAVACRQDGGWRVEFAVNAPLPPEGFVPASSAAAFDAYFEAVADGGFLPPEEEAALLWAAH